MFSYPSLCLPSRVLHLRVKVSANKSPLFPRLLLVFLAFVQVLLIASFFDN